MISRYLAWEVLFLEVENKKNFSWNRVGRYKFGCGYFEFEVPVGHSDGVVRIRWIPGRRGMG